MLFHRSTPTSQEPTQLLLSLLTQTMISQRPSRLVSGAAEKFTVQPRCLYPTRQNSPLYSSASPPFCFLPPQASFVTDLFATTFSSVPHLLRRRTHSIITAVIFLQSHQN
jgi:hypothetical protein